MPRAIRVEVTQDDIDRAMRSDSSRCVVAQAVARTVPHATRISVDIQTVRFTDGDGVRRVYLTPTAVEQYVVGFDAGDEIKPFAFGLYESQRVNVPRKAKSTAGRKRDAAADSVKRATRALAKINADPEASEAQRIVAAERVAAAEQARAETYANTQGEPWHPPAEERRPPEMEGVITAKRAPAKGAGSNERKYGHRVLRLNWKDQPTT